VIFLMADYNDDLSLNSSITSPYQGKLLDKSQYRRSAEPSAAISVAVRKPQVVPVPIPQSGYVSDNASYAATSVLSEPNLSHIFPPMKSSHATSRIKRRIIPRKGKRIIIDPPESSLWSSAENEDMYSLEEKYIQEEAQQLVQSLRGSPEVEQEAILSNRATPVVSRAPSIEINEPASLEESIPPPEAEPAAEEKVPNPPKPDEVIEESKPKARKIGGSKAKSKLKNLNRFVLGHTSRKITSNWDLVENKFQASNTHEIVIVKGADGIGNPMKLKTMALSSMTLLLCSAQVQLKHKELSALYELMKFSQADVDRSCKIAARKLVMMASSNVDVQKQCSTEIEELTTTPEPKIRIDILRESVFSADPEERKKEMEQLEKFRTERVNNMFEEKRKKKENLAKAEARKRKAINDFENSVLGIQYPRGPLSQTRLSHLRAIIDYAHDILLEEYYEKTVAVDPFVVDLLGADMFPNTTSGASVMGLHDSSEGVKSVTKKAALLKAGISKKVFPPGSSRVDLAGPPSLFTIFRRAIMHGKGLYGTSNNDVVELVQAYAATRLQTNYRGFTRRWRYRVARRAWKHLYNFMKARVFVAWATDTKQIRTLRHYCFRKVKAWRYYTKQNLRRKHHFRVCYWPFFVWRRHATETGRAKEKTKFLVTRVMPTYALLSTFRGWKRYYIFEANFNKPADRFYAKHLDKQRKVFIHWWLYWTRRRKGLRRSWVEKGYIMRCLKIEDSIRLPFQIWRAATVFKVRTRDFVKRNTRQFRQFLFPNIAIHLPPVKIKLSDEDKKKLIEEVTLAEGSASTSDSLDSKKSRQLAKAKLKALRRVQTTSDVEPTDRSLSTVELQAFSRQLGTPFRWKDDLDRFDIGLSADETLHCSSIFHSIHNRYYEMFPGVGIKEYDAADYGLKFHTIKRSTKSLIDELRDRFYEVEVWTLFDSAFRYHRVAHRVFKNLRVHARVNKNSRNTKYQYRNNLLRKVLYAFLRWATRGMDDSLEDGGGRDTIQIEHSRAEELAFIARTTRMEKLKKRRDAAKAFKERESMLREKEQQTGCYGSVPFDDGNDEFLVDAGPRARQRRLSLAFKRIMKPKSPNTSPDLKCPNDLRIDAKLSHSYSYDSSSISQSPTCTPTADFVPFSGKGSSTVISHAQSDETVSDKRSIKRTASDISTYDASQHVMEPVDMLAWDRHERDQELDLMQQMMKYGREVASQTRKTVRQMAKESAKHTAVNDNREEILLSIFKKEELRTEKSILRELDYVSGFKVRMASNMVDVLYKIHGEVVHTMIVAQKRQYFRRLRMPLLLLRSIHMLNRKRLVNWIRICKRLNVLYSKVPLFRSMKLKWMVFNRWLKFFEKENLDCSSGLISLLKSRWEKRSSFNNLLVKRQFIPTVYPRNGRLKESTHDSIAIFLRWKEWTQDMKVFNLITQKVKVFHRLRVLEKCFWCIRTNISLKVSYDVRKKIHCYAYVRALADLEQISKRFFALRRRSLSVIVTKYQTKCQVLLKKVAKKSLTFRKFVNVISADVATRLMTEQKLLLSAFEKRGTFVYKDVKVKSKMNTIPGERFSDPKISTPDKVSVPAGYNLIKIKVAVQHGLGIVGWQLFWGADCCIPMESPVRGKISGSGITQLEFVMKPNDFLVEVEYIAEGNVMTGIRFKTFYNGWSRWLGNRANQLSKKYRLSSSMAELDAKDGRYKPGGWKESLYPGMPWDYIIGFGGTETSVRATCMSIVTRKVTLQHIFSYNWVGELSCSTKRNRAETVPENENDEEPGATVFPPIVSSQPTSVSFNKKEELERHLSDLQSECSVELDDDGAEPDITLSPSEEQFFDVVRMRSVEIKAAQVRALGFARRVWSSMKHRRDPVYHWFTSINILTGLTRWFLESLCKSLVAAPDDANLVAKLYDLCHVAQVELEILDARLAGAEGTLAATEASERLKPWYGKALLGPQLRQLKKEFHDNIKDQKDALIEMEQKRLQLEARIEKLDEAADRKLPRFQLSATVCKNFRQKIGAARYKSNLLEKMSLESLKEHLGGKSSSSEVFKLSDADQERIRLAKQRNAVVASEMDTLLNVVDDNDELLRSSKASTSAREDLVTPSLGKRDVTQRVRAEDKIPNAVANSIIVRDDFTFVQTQKKTYRKHLAVNPGWGAISKPKLSQTMPPIKSTKHIT